MKNLKEIIAISVCAVTLLACFTGCSGEKSPLDPKNPTTVTIWNYYNGAQLSAFDELVKEFNNSVGQEKGIIVTSESKANINKVASDLIDSVNGTVGAAKIPSAAAIYPETAFILHEKDSLATINSYFSETELASYVPDFVDEGRLTENGDLYLLPVSKSTEAFIVNATDWKPFADATGITAESIKTYEDLTSAAEAYYNWSDALTPDVANDGKALYGRDSLSNYLFVGAKQLGHELFKVASDGKVTTDFDKNTFKTLWENYYIPFVKGYFASDSSYRSEDVKTGRVISMTGSTSGITYIPTIVTESDDTTRDITIEVAKALHFKDGESIYVQQGAGFCIMKTSEAEQYATAEFLKWFTDEQQNMSFSITSGYSPVKTSANSADKIKENFKAETVKDTNMLNALLISADVYSNDKTYTCRAFAESREMRSLLEDELGKVCKDDRAAVEEAISSGKTREEALSNYISDEHFEEWFSQLCSKIIKSDS